MLSAISLAFCGDILAPRSFAETLIFSPLAFRFLVRRVPFECSGQSKLTQFMPDHVFGNINGDVLFAIVNTKSQANKLRQYR